MPKVTDLIPHRPPFLFVDEIVSETADGLTAKRTWRAEEDFYDGHYPGAPITPGVLLCEAVFQTAACFMALKARAAGAKPGEGVPLHREDQRSAFPQSGLSGRNHSASR